MLHLLIALAGAAMSIPPTDTCPLSPEQRSIGLVLIDEKQTSTPIGMLVTCSYGGNSTPLNGLLSFSPRCPSSMSLIQAGYYFGAPNFKNDMRVIGLVPKPLADGRSATDIVMYGDNANPVNVDAYVYCRT